MVARDPRRVPLLNRRDVDEQEEEFADEDWRRNGVGAGHGAGSGRFAGAQCQRRRLGPASQRGQGAHPDLEQGVAQIIAPAMAGYIATASGSYHGALVVTALVMGCGVVALQALIHEEKRAAQAVGAR